MGNKEGPKLGLATTQELLDELFARFEIDINLRAKHYVYLASEQCTQAQLEYRTVDIDG